MEMMPSKLRLRVNISIERDDRSSERLNVSEEVMLNDKSFMEICGILGEFQKLTETFKEKP
jgi:hypothetical protein